VVGQIRKIDGGEEWVKLLGEDLGIGETCAKADQGPDVPEDRREDHRIDLRQILQIVAVALAAVAGIIGPEQRHRLLPVVELERKMTFRP